MGWRGKEAWGSRASCFPGHLGLDAVDLGDEVDLLAAATVLFRVSIHIL